MAFHLAIFALLMCSHVIHEDGYAIYKKKNTKSGCPKLMLKEIRESQHYPAQKKYQSISTQHEIQIRPISSPIDVML